MNFFSGYEFFVYLIFALIPAIFLGIKEKSLKNYRILLTLFFIYMVYKDNIIEFTYLIIYIIISCYLVKIYLFLRNKYGKNTCIYGHAIFVAILPVVLSKISGLYGLNIFGFLGVSYICFRVVQIIIEIYDGIITKVDIGTFILFLLFFPTLSSGPIDRSRHFEEENKKIYSKKEYIEMLQNGSYKIILGMFYKMVCATLFYEILSNIFMGRYKPIYIIGYAYVYGIYMFFDFAGYSAMAVGTSYILGINMPDNFNKPFLSIDIKEFWNRWHITLSTWFRDFIFTRFMLDSTRKKRFNSRLSRASVGLILNMFIMGVWHGIGIQYIIYGIYHGVLLAGTEIYQKKSKFYQKNKNQMWYKIFSWFLTLNMVMFGFLIFSGHISEIWKILIMYL